MSLITFTAAVLLLLLGLGTSKNDMGWFGFGLGKSPIKEEPKSMFLPEPVFKDQPNFWKDCTAYPHSKSEIKKVVNGYSKLKTVSEFSMKVGESICFSTLSPGNGDGLNETLHDGYKVKLLDTHHSYDVYARSRRGVDTHINAEQWYNVNAVSTADVNYRWFIDHAVELCGQDVRKLIFWRGFSVWDRVYGYCFSIHKHDYVDLLKFSNSHRDTALFEISVLSLDGKITTYKSSKLPVGNHVESTTTFGNSSVTIAYLSALQNYQNPFSNVDLVIGGSTHLIYNPQDSNTCDTFDPQKRFDCPFSFDKEFLKTTVSHDYYAYRSQSKYKDLKLAPQYSLFQKGTLHYEQYGCGNGIITGNNFKDASLRVSIESEMQIDNYFVNFGIIKNFIVTLIEDQIFCKITKVSREGIASLNLIYNSTIISSVSLVAQENVEAVIPKIMLIVTGANFEVCTTYGVCKSIFINATEYNIDYKHIGLDRNPSLIEGIYKPPRKLHALGKFFAQIDSLFSFMSIFGISFAKLGSFIFLCLVLVFFSFGLKLTKIFEWHKYVKVAFIIMIILLVIIILLYLCYWFGASI